MRPLSNPQPEPGAAPIPHVRSASMPEKTDSARIQAEVSAAVDAIETDAFKLLYAVIATLRGEPARCTRRSCRVAGHCTAAADNDFCRQPGVYMADSMAHAGREFLLRHAHKHPLPKPGRARRDASEP
jgi:hypothetical protein